MTQQTLSTMKIRKDFPILQQTINEHPLVYFDNAATTQKPRSVIDAITNFYETTNSNIHRGIHHLSQEATAQYEHTRSMIQQFINARSEKEIIFTKGTTESINLVATTWGRENIKQGDEILLTEMEHHSNIVPWIMLTKEQGATIQYIPINDNGELELSKLDTLISKNTKLIAVTHISNTLGTINPIKEIIQKAHTKNIPVLIDGAQSPAHTSINVQELDCEFYTFSGHKMYGPTGTGILYAKEEILQHMPPYQGGGEMITSVSFEQIEYAELPHKFEAGTPNIAGIIALGNAVEFIQRIGYHHIQTHEQELLDDATKKMQTIPGLNIIGQAQKKIGIISFIVDNIHPHDLGTILSEEGIAVRTGQHCTEPIMQHFQIPGTARISFAVYNTKEEIDRFIQILNEAIVILTS